MLAAKTELKHAEKVKQFLQKHSLLHPDFFPVKEFGFIYFPLIRKQKIPFAQTLSVPFSFPGKEKRLSIEDVLRGKLTPTEMKLLPHSQEIVGKILILEIPEELHSKEKMIAETYLQSNKSIETVVKKDDAHAGEYRLRKVKVLAGKNTKETIHQENGIKIKLDLEKTYFSARSAHERLRIAKQIKNPEDVLVMFSGAAPYPLVIARNSPAKRICAVEINPLAHAYAAENIALNKLEHKIVLYLGDVHQVLPAIKNKFDRVAMPLPKTGKEFLDVALIKAKPGAIIHFYAFLAEEEMAAEARKIKELCSQLKHPVRVLRKVKCGQFSPRVFRVCFDLKVLK